MSENQHIIGELEQCAQSLLDENRLGEAKDIYQQLCELEPSDAESWFMLGALNGELGQLEVSASCLHKALQLKPDHAGANFTLSRICQHQGRIDEALDYCQRSVSSDPEFTEAWELLGAMLSVTGDYSAAETAYRQLVRLQPEHATIINLLAGTQLQLGKLDEAFMNCERALRLEPKSPEIHANFGNVLIVLNKLQAAERHFRTALQLKPGFIGAKVNLANILIKQGKPQEAIEYFQQLLRSNPGVAEIHLDLGTAYQSLGRFDEAMRSYQQALSISPSNPNVLLNIGYLLKLEGKLGAALKYYKQAVQLAPDYPLAHYNLALTCKALGEFDIAIEHCRRAVEYAPDLIDARLSLALLELLTGNLAEGWKYYGARRSVRDTQESMLTALAADLQDAQLLVTKDQGIGDEIFFLRFVPLLKARGAKIAYRADDKIAHLVARLPYIDQVLTSRDATDPAAARISVGDLPGLLNINDTGLIPPPVRLEPLPEAVNQIQQQLNKFGNPPFIGVTWCAGTKVPPMKALTTDRLAHREIPVDLLANTLRSVNGTVLVLQRNPEPGDIDRLNEHLGRNAFDLSALNDELEEMLALLSLLDEYVGVDNTNMHLRLAAGKGSRILVPHPPEWRSAAYGSSSPWFPACTMYRQTISGDWNDAVNACRADITAEMSARFDTILN